MDNKNPNVPPISSPTPGLNDPIRPVMPLNPPTPQPINKKPSAFQGFLSTFLLIGGALVFALLINQFIFQSYEVDGSSMSPSLHNKDRLIIWKLPKSWAGITKHKFTPRRGDIIVFHKPDGSKEQLIKRVIGLPGDRVIVSDNKITVFNKEHPDGFDPDDAPYGNILPPTSGNVDVNVNEGEVFVSGDNRIPGASLDSRSSLGNIDLDLIVGKLVLRLYPFNQFDTF